MRTGINFSTLSTAKSANKVTDHVRDRLQTSHIGHIRPLLDRVHGLPLSLFSACATIEPGRDGRDHGRCGGFLGIDALGENIPCLRMLQRTLHYTLGVVRRGAFSLARPWRTVKVSERQPLNRIRLCESGHMCA
ncbi:hypothetical protein J7T55_014892 [Diaporthe amygdali]|uniref:uncharacterized protein n=1 Tax=Phomopsis amygdali TaxID=1214568 RepID=UPI0022FE3312|nr:uncharacterized protein J7T55_014892 [Diaporthe amygdali]KAJ0110089.1 hypothetical protein J7T55_014892 [Diaporthe amygdali]